MNDVPSKPLDRPVAGDYLTINRKEGTEDQFMLEFNRAGEKVGRTILVIDCENSSAIVEVLSMFGLQKDFSINSYTWKLKQL